MNKGKLNFIIDVIMFVLMGALSGIGLLIKYVLLSGENRWIKYGRNVDLSYLGLDRHEWGTIHFWVAITLVVLLILHIIFHWKIILCLYKKLMGNKKGRIICGSLFSIITLLFVIFPFLIKVNVSEIKSGRERFGSEQQLELNKIEKPEINNNLSEHYEDSKVNETNTEHHHIDELIEVKGFNTLNEISELYQVPCNHIKSKLNIPESVSNSSKLGHLRKQYNFKMSDIELIIYNYQNSENHEKDN